MKFWFGRIVYTEYIKIKKFPLNFISIIIHNRILLKIFCETQKIVNMPPQIWGGTPPNIFKIFSFSNIWGDPPKYLRPSPKISKKWG